MANELSVDAGKVGFGFGKDDRLTLTRCGVKIHSDEDLKVVIVSRAQLGWMEHG